MIQRQGNYQEKPAQCFLNFRGLKGLDLIWGEMHIFWNNPHMIQDRSRKSFQKTPPLKQPPESYKGKFKRSRGQENLYHIIHGTKHHKSVTISTWMQETATQAALPTLTGTVACICNCKWRSFLWFARPLCTLGWKCRKSESRCRMAPMPNNAPCRGRDASLRSLKNTAHT